MNTYYSSNNLSYVDWTSVPMLTCKLAQKGRNFPTFATKNIFGFWNIYITIQSVILFLITVQIIENACIENYNFEFS